MDTSSSNKVQQGPVSGKDQVHNGAAAAAGAQTAQTTNQEHQPDWDMYPGAIRKIENQGSDKDVEALHNLEHSCEKNTQRKL
ncbi:hypothetical protein BX616_005595 [Lobosporangium transversale]|uniref:Uncharacterized protein n=1 Tax=Lobosporangium transversale TaxID=64571 RepID=A0A1Y2GP29_9FUNG|nr:hypothetical protein BCR41DRAFT_353986 [Lobosporangium transversale]KAF9897435.1 hypothetical protein BX616_005595 [Lobosporangium transversale]ORZ15521.1 hypothetical protein BCR41DRAFT_353986 [Lobosporangium transversale]|eukprot:XP_021881269.1 hypothetical protein BCR41DRAFT_353986 [Lobosporangium transversale]